MTRACLVFGCPEPVASRGRCAKHARQVDVHRSLGADRQAGRALYASKAWRDLRRAVLAFHPWCECPACVAGMLRNRATVVHHIKPHGGDRRLFFSPDNLLAMSKDCHDALTVRAVRGYTPGVARCRVTPEEKPRGRVLRSAGSLTLAPSVTKGAACG